LKQDVFFVRLRAIVNKELLTQVQCLCLYCIGTQPGADRTQEFISVHLSRSVRYLGRCNGKRTNVRETSFSDDFDLDF